MSEKEGGAQPQQQQSVELKITMDAQGQVFIHGPLEMEVLCLGLLEKGKQALLAWNERRQREARKREQSKKIQLASVADLKSTLEKVH